MKALEKIYQFKLLYAFVGISLLFFLIKGIEYAIIGSYIPLVFIVMVSLAIYWSFSSTLKTHNSLLKFWGMILITWGLARFSVWVAMKVDTSLTESHIREQFGIIEHLITTLIFIIGVIIIRQLSRSAKLVRITSIKNK